MSERIQSVDRVVSILKTFLTSEDAELKLVQIVEQTGLHKSTVHGLIQTMRYHGLIDQDETTQKYRLGTALIGFGEKAKSSLAIVQISRPVMREICDQVEETVHLAMLRDTSVIYIEKIESKQSIRMTSAIGLSNPAYCTGVGKVLLSGLPNQEVPRHLPKVMEQHTAWTIHTVTDLLAELEEIRRNGFGEDRQELEEGLDCIAFPIFNHEGKVAFAMSISGPSFRMKSKRELVTKLLIEGSEEISRKLGYQAVRRKK